jgi:hypothetical protein
MPDTMRVFFKIEAFVDVECDSRDRARKIIGPMVNYEYEPFDVGGMEFHTVAVEIVDIDPIGDDEDSNGNIIARALYEADPKPINTEVYWPKPLWDEVAADEPIEVDNNGVEAPFGVSRSDWEEVEDVDHTELPDYD